MSLKRPFAWIAALVVVISVASVARAQTMPVSHASHVGVNPFIEPDYFRPDFQFFAPSQVDPYSGGEAPNLGFYGTYDRLYINVARPDAQNSNSPSGLPGDFASGWRFDLGYMTPERKGWEVSAWHIGGPNVYQSTGQERINRRNEDDPSDGLDDGTGGGGGGGAAGAVLPQDKNPRQYSIADSLNVAHFSSFELNKVWRFKEFHYGGVFEPLVGLRYMQFIDFGRADSYQRFASDADDEPDLSLPNTAGPWEVYQTNRSQFQNSMLGGQIGFRYSKQTGHWLLSTEFRAFAMQNWQFFTVKAEQISTLYDGTDQGAAVLRELNQVAFADTHRSELVWGGELRAEAAYEITRDINIRGGFVMMDLGKGIGRGQNPNQNTQDVFMWGWTAGFTLNR
jgi:hypothetical protein